MHDLQQHEVLWHSAYVVISVGFLNQASLFLVNQSLNIYFVVELKMFVRLCFGICDFFPFFAVFYSHDLLSGRWIVLPLYLFSLIYTSAVLTAVSPVC